MKYNVSTKGFEIYTSSKTKCSYCGHSMLLGRAERVICSYCGHFIFKNKKLKFLYEMQAAINKNKR